MAPHWRALGAVEIHDSLCRAKTQPGERDCMPQAVRSGQGIVPVVWGIAIHLLQKCGQIRAPQHAVHFVGQVHGVGCSPGRQDTGMHHQQRFAGVDMLTCQRLQAQPVSGGRGFRGSRRAAGADLLSCERPGGGRDAAAR